MDMKSSIKTEKRNWPRETPLRSKAAMTEQDAMNRGWPTATQNDRIIAGQNDTEEHRSVLMILSCHDSVCIPGLQEKRKRDFEQEATERTGIQREKSLFPWLNFCSNLPPAKPCHVLV